MFAIFHMANILIGITTRMLAINVSIANPTVARQEQFRSSQLRIQRATNRCRGWL